MDHDPIHDPAESGSDPDPIAALTRRWINDSGHALEMRVARTLWRSGASDVVHSYAYRDPVLAKVRETDVVAKYRWRSATTDVVSDLAAVVECKSGTSKPWVAMFDRRLTAGRDVKSWVYSATIPDSRVTDELSTAWPGLAPFADRQVATHIATVDSSTNLAGDAVRQVVSATQALHDQHVHGLQQQGLVTMPIVVIAAPLFACSLEDDGDFSLSRIERCSVWAPTPSGSATKRVLVVREAELRTVGLELAERVRDVSASRPWS